MVHPSSVPNEEKINSIQFSTINKLRPCLRLQFVEDLFKRTVNVKGGRESSKQSFRTGLS